MTWTFVVIVQYWISCTVFISIATVTLYCITPHIGRSIFCCWSFRLGWTKTSISHCSMFLIIRRKINLIKFLNNSRLIWTYKKVFMYIFIITVYKQKNFFHPLYYIMYFLVFKKHLIVWFISIYVTYDPCCIICSKCICVFNGLKPSVIFKIHLNFI